MPDIHCEHTELKEPESLTGHPHNPNTHSDEQIRLLAQIIKHQGWRNPIVVSRRSNFIVAGHARLKAALLLNEKEVPVDFQDFETEADEYAHLVADNRIAELAEVDNVALVELIKELEGAGLSTELAGFNADGMDELMKDIGIEEEEKDAEPQEDKAEELRAKWGVNPGQMWSLGDHRLICGDSTDRDTVDRVSPDKCDLCFTDPPYGVEYEYNQHDDTREGLIDLIAGFLPIAKDKAKVVALTSGTHNMFLYPPPTWVLCWFYGVGTGMTPWGFTCWQPILVYGKDPKLASGEGPHPDGFNVVMSRDDGNERKSLAHNCPKPLSVWLKFIKRLSNKKTRTVYDPFCGSGTTLIACENQGLACYSVEIDPGYCAVTIQRWADATGKEPELL